MAELRAKHPLLPADSVIPAAPATSSSAHIVVDPTSQVFINLVKDSDNGASPGPSGWGGDMLSCLINDPACMQGLATMVQLILDNKVPAVIRPYLLSCRLIPLTKPSGGIRPIAVSELLYKLAAKYAAMVVSKQAKTLLAPHQFSIATSNGCEKIIHTMQLRLTDSRHTPLAGMSVDIVNAFNSCDRALLLNKLYATPELAELFPIVSFAYSSPSKLLLRQGAGPTIWSTNGVRQGDPLSGLLFCLYMREVYDAVAAAASVTLYSYMDNLYIVGVPDQVMAAFDTVKQQLQSVRLECNRSKSCFIYLHDEATHPLPTAVVSSLADEGIEIRRDYAEVLGAIIGANEQAIIDGLASFCSTEKMAHFFRRLCHPNLSSQAAMRLLSKCGVPKLSYRLRCHPPPCMTDQATAMDEMVLSTATQLLDLTSQRERKSKVIKQLQAPLRFGGHGLISAVESAHTAYYCSVLSCSSMPHIQQELQSWSTQTSAQDSSPPKSSMLHQHLDECISNIKTTITGTDSNLVRPDLVPSSASEIIPHYQQHQVVPFVQQEVTAISSKLQLQAVVAEAEAEGDETTLARLLGVTAPGASDWLTTDPSSPALSMSNIQYQISSKIRLGMPPLPLPSDCASCHTQDACALDPLHPLVCIGQKGTKITHRHDGATDAVHVSTIHAGGLSYKEPRDLSGNGDHTRPDLQLVLNGRQLLVDVTIRHPACKTNIMHGSARQQLAAAHKGEAEKKAKYASMAKTQQAEFLPFAVETYGGLGKAARKLRKRIASSAEEGPQMLSEKEVMRELRGSVAIAVQKGNANIILAEYHRAMSAATRSGRGMGAFAA